MLCRAGRKREVRSQLSESAAPSFPALTLGSLRVHLAVRTPESAHHGLMRVNSVANPLSPPLIYALGPDLILQGPCPRP